MKTVTTRRVKELPGPKGIPLLGNLFQINPKQFHRQLEKWCDDYGPFYQFKIAQKSFVVVSDIETITEILRKRPDGFRRMSSIESVTAELASLGVFSSEGDAWRKQRKLTMPAFQTSHLKAFFPLLVETTGRLKKRWERSWQSQEDVDLCRDLMRYTVDITTWLAFDYDLNTLEEEGDLIQKDLERVLGTVGRRVNAPVPYWRYLKLPADRAVDRALKKIRKKTDEIILSYEERVRQDPSLKERSANLLEAFLNARESDGTRFTPDEIFANLVTILLTGEDTTAHVMAWAFHYLIENPEIQKKVKEEVDRVLGDADLLRSYEESEKLHYTEAVILEAMRLKSPAPLLFLEPVSDITVGGLNLTKGTNVVALLTYAGWQDETFSLAKKFCPERWISSLRPAEWNHDLKAFIPFGNGPRFCPGRSLAMLEMKAVIAMACRNFNLDKPRNGQTPCEEFTFVMAAKDIWASLGTPD